MEREKEGRFAVASGSCGGGKGMSSSGERGSPLRGMRGRRGAGRGDSFGKKPRERGDEEGKCGQEGGWCFFPSRRTQGEKGGFAVASGSREGGGGTSSSGERGSPLRGMRGGRGAGKGGRGQRGKRGLSWKKRRERGGGEIGGDGRRDVFPAGERDWGGVKQRAGRRGRWRSGKAAGCAILRRNTKALGRDCRGRPDQSRTLS